MDRMDLLVAILGLLGGAAVGGAVGGGLMGALAAWTGLRLRIAIGAFALLGASAGSMIAGGIPMPSLSHLFAQVTQQGDEAKLAQVMKTYYPDDYREVETEMTTLHATGASEAQAQAAMRRIALPLIQRQLPLASTDNAMAYLDIAREEQKVMAANPDLCLKMMTQPGPDTVGELQQVLPDDLKAREAHLSVQLLEQTATAPQPPKPPADLKNELTIWTRDAYDGLSFEERDALTQGGPLRGKAACDYLGNMLTIIYWSGQTTAPEAFKAISSQGFQPSSQDFQSVHGL